MTIFKAFIRLTLTLSVLIVSTATMPQAWAQPLHPTGQRCRDTTPLSLSESWCGCTWGAVYVDGTPVAGAQITLTVGSRTLTYTTALVSSDPFPIYDVTAYTISATYGNLATIQASYGGATLSRTVRLVPNIDGEQLVNLVFPQTHFWRSFAATPIARGLAISGTTVWTGSPTGPVQWNTATGVSITHSTGQVSATVQAVAIAPTGQVFVGTPSGLSMFDGTAWTAQSLGLADANVRAIAIAPNGDVWVGVYGETGGGLSWFNGTNWQAQPDFNGGFPNLVTALAFDSTGGLWVGTDDSGVSRWDGSTWTTYRTQQGLASNTVTSLAAEPGAMWLGTLAYSTSSGAFGGASKFSLSNNTWTTYTQASGLASNNITGIAIDSLGNKWFGTAENGISRFDNQNWFTYNISNGLSADAIRNLVIGSAGEVWLTTPIGIDRWASGATNSVPPTLTQAQAQWNNTGEIAFAATAMDSNAIRSYEWRSSLDGVIGTEITYTLRTSALSGGLHTVTVRAQDGAGDWSAPLTTTLRVNRVMLPMVVK